jgi:FkbM family methyltransferase
VKALLQRFLRELGIYHRLKASAVYDIYWRLVDPRVIQQAEAELEFYRKVLPSFRAGDLIFDVGANQGTKTRTFLRLGARVIAIEPDPTNQEILRASFLKRRFTPPPVILVPAALSESIGTERLWVDEPGSAKNTLSPKWVDILRHDGERFGHTHQFGRSKTVQTTTLDALIRKHGRPFFVKIDVEGSEARVLRGLSRPVPNISFEVNLPEFLEEGLECVKRLEGLEARGAFNYVVHYEEGLALPAWLSGQEFALRLRLCRARSVEVFWKCLGAR